MLSEALDKLMIAKSISMSYYEYLPDSSTKKGLHFICDLQNYCREQNFIMDP